MNSSLLLKKLEPAELCWASSQGSILLLSTVSWLLRLSGRVGLHVRFSSLPFLSLYNGGISNSGCPGSPKLQGLSPWPCWVFWEFCFNFVVSWLLISAWSLSLMGPCQLLIGKHLWDKVVYMGGGAHLHTIQRILAPSSPIWLAFWCLNADALKVEFPLSRCSWQGYWNSSWCPWYLAMDVYF